MRIEKQDHVACLLPVGRGPHSHLLLLGVEFLQCPKKTNFLRVSWEND